MNTRQEQKDKIAQARAAAEDMRKTREKQLPQGAQPEPAPAPAPALRRETDKPWDAADPRLTIPLQGRFPERIHLKMLWVKENTKGGISLQKIMHQAIEEFCDREIERLGGPEMNAVDHDVILAAVRAGSVTYEQAADLFMGSHAGEATGVSRDHFLVLIHTKFPTQEALAGAMRKYLDALPPDLFDSIDPKHFN